jgi:hypothetical protein
MMNALTFLCYGDVSFVGKEDGGRDYGFLLLFVCLFVCLFVWFVGSYEEAEDVQ